MAAAARIPLLRDPLLAVYAFLALGFLLPGRLIVAPLGGVGAPATLAAFAAAILYVFGRLVPDVLAGGIQPVRTAIAVFGCASLVAYGVGLNRFLLDAEAASMDRTLINTIGFVGLGLLTVDGVRSRDHLDRLLKLIVGGASALAVMGITQYVTGAAPQDYITVPGLTLQDVTINAERSFLTRVMATTQHPIEYGVVLAVALPLALHYATVSRDGSKPTRWWWLSVLLILTGIPMSVSRSSVLGVAVGATVVAVTWSWRRRLNALMTGLLLVVAMRAAFPGLLGTLRSLFLFFGEDPSIEGRTQDYPLVWAYVQEAPWLGRGLGTFPPEVYFYLDNEYLNRILTGGLLGLAAMAALLLVALGTGRGVFHHATDPSARALGQALVASTAVTAFTWFTYDGLAFRLAAGTAFVIMGAAGALWRLEVGGLHWGESLDRSRPLTRAADPDLRRAEPVGSPGPGAPTPEPATVGGPPRVAGHPM